MDNNRTVTVDIELTDAQILKVASEIYLENPTKFLMEITTLATSDDMAGALDNGMNLG